MPMPSSETLRRARPSSATDADTSTRPPRGEYLIALPTRLTRTWRSRSTSPATACCGRSQLLAARSIRTISRGYSIALAASSFADFRAVAAGLSAGLFAVALVDVPFQGGLFVAIVVGIGVGLLGERPAPARAPVTGGHDED